MILALVQCCLSELSQSLVCFSLHLILFHAAMLFILKIIGWYEDGEVTGEYA